MARHHYAWALEPPAVIAIILICAASVYSVFVNGPPHEFSESECFNCHFTVPEEGDPGPYPLVEEVTAMCTGCHDVSPLSHVVDVQPLIGIHEGMPLSPAGTITCVTCHDPHSSPTDPVTGGKTYFLRLAPPGKPFCLLCHEDPMYPGEVTIFAASGGVTHRRSIDVSHGVAHFEVVDPFAELDPLSVICIGCHDSSEDEPDSSRLGMGIWDHGGGIGLSHPIGAYYADAARNNPEYVSEWDLDKRINLFDGKIGCCSCHDMYATGGGPGIVIGVQDICTACHMK